MQLPLPSLADRDNRAVELESRTLANLTYHLLKWTNAQRVWYTIRVTDGWNAPFTFGGRSFRTEADARTIYDTIVAPRRPSGWCSCAGDQLAAGNAVYFDGPHGHGWNCATCGLLLQEG